MTKSTLRKVQNRCTVL